jgi:4-alpha-glucanotransferase
LHETGQTYWQVLPLGPTGFADSPYQCLSSFAGNTMLISPDSLVHMGLLSARDVQDHPTFPHRLVDYAAVNAWRKDILALAYDAFLAGGGRGSPDFQDFRTRNQDWLDDYALFAALKESHDLRPWWAWPRGEALSGRAALAQARGHLRHQIEEHQFRQWLFFSQWEDLRRYARSRDIQIIGDIPIYAARDSADVWANLDLFELDEEGNPTAVAGVPPDYFSATGQLWGNPLYRWSEHGRTGYQWWIKRIRAARRMADLVRIDHFRAFWNYWSVPAGEATAIYGQWREAGYAPRDAFFNALRHAFRAEQPPVELSDFIIAEDLGDQMEEVITWRTERLKLPGMKILQFAFGQNPEEVGRFTPRPYTPGAEEDNHILYTGTHDNNTVQGWWHFDIDASEADRVRGFSARWPHRQGAWEGQHPERLLIEIGMSCNTRVFIAPVQDIFGLGRSSRMNTPGTTGGNWRWRCDEHHLDPHRPEWQEIRRLTQMWDRSRKK